jgi:tagatose-1,6-bisphosphate aldolase non-catalytic subunit AgaZ/GatZ
VELAFLSACHSGTSALSGFYLPDENIHFSTAFVLAGFPSVIATRYVYGDHSTDVAKDVYSYLLRDSDRVRPDFSATALHFAVRKLKKNLQGKTIPDNPLLWAGYIHSDV